MAHCLKGYLLLGGGESCPPRADRRHPGRRPSRCRHRHAARTAACRRLRRLGGRCARQILRDLAADPRRPPDRSAGVAHLRHDLVPPRPDRDDPANRPTASRRAGPPICPATNASRPSGPSRMRRPATPGRRTRGRCRAGTGPHELLRPPRQGAHHGDGVPRRARAATGSAARSPHWSLGNNLIHHSGGTAR